MIIFVLTGVVTVTVWLLTLCGVVCSVDVWPLVFKVVSFDFKVVSFAVVFSLVSTSSDVCFEVVCLVVGLLVSIDVFSVFVGLFDIVDVIVVVDSNIVVFGAV